MFTESKITEIYCMADDFCKEFALPKEKCLNLFTPSFVVISI